MFDPQIETYILVQAEMQEARAEGVPGRPVVVVEGTVGYLCGYDAASGFQPAWSDCRRTAYRFTEPEAAIAAFNSSTGMPWMFVPKPDTARLITITAVRIETVEAISPA